MTLAPELRDALAALARTPQLLLALDFDGTMAPIVSRAGDARPLPRSAAALQAFTELPGTTTALVSGRALASLREVATPPAPTLLVGSHGAESWWGPDSPALELTVSQQAVLDEARTSVAVAVGANPGTLAEHKPAGVVLHYRLAEAEHARNAVEHVLKTLGNHPGLHISTGKMVLEISAIKADKGQSLTALREFCGATAVFFAGDDVTDEHAFAALQPGDLGIKVGPGTTAAPHRIETPDDLPEVLEFLLQARQAFLTT